MGSIGNIQEPWHGHTGLEVETFIKSQLSALASMKFGRVEWDGSSLTFYDEEGGSIIQSVSLGGEVYTITVDSDLGTAFYVLGSETTKVITLTPTTEVGSIGSSEREPFPEAYTLAMAIDNGSGYRPIPLPSEQSNIPVGGSSSIDLRPYVINGNNYIRFTFTGLTSGQVKSMICTATVTSLQMSCNHTWQTPWEEGQDYTINGIRFAGSLEKVLHIAVDGTEVGTVPYSANQSYTTTATSYTIAASYFPADSSGVHTITLWMTATGVSTPVIPLNIMCVMSGSTTPLICINAIANKAVNFTAGQLFAYAVYNAEFAKFNVTATMGTSSTPIPVVLDRVVAAVAGTQYPFTADLQIESEEVSGTLTAVATALDANQSEGASQTITMSIDNTYSYIATSGALFYMNPANRSNDEANHEVIINEGTPDQRFAASYNGVWSGLAWSTKDGWATDPDGHKCLAIPAGGSLSVPTFAPLGFFSSYDNGMTVELMIQPVYPSDYDTPILTLSDAVSREGITIYPTKIVVLGSNVAQENRQMVNICENRITHLTVTFMKNYAQQGGSFNLCSIYVNGTSNICFSFGGDTAFGNGSLTIGAPDVDTYIYKMRVYGKALEARDVLNNFLNCVIDGVEFTRSDVYADNDILDGGVVDYEKTKAAGYNTMVITMDSDSHDIPSYNNNAVFSHCSWRFEYADHPEWNVTLEDVELDGQGTTSKQYYRWNLRDKHSDNTRWLYDSPDIEDTTGKKGYFAGTGYPKVDRITAKKNYASSMQGHKMGMTGLYDDLFTELGLKNELPSTNFNVAVYQFPFVGFRYYEQSGAYEFIGIYTAGPDKGSKVTFGYSSDYPNCLSLEGPNHNPLGTRFLVPWVDMAYDPSQETLTYGGQEGWDCDYVKFETSTKGTQSDWDNIMGLYESEWKPAYEIVYHCSPYIASIQETGYASLAAINADIDTFLEGTTNGVSNALMSFYDTNYDLCFYRISTGRFDTLTVAEGKSTFNLKTYLGLTGSPTTAQIKTARAAKFKSEWGNYWSVNQTIFQYCYYVLFGVTDNFVKNSYPVKFRGYNETLGTGESAECKKWGWRQDDLDTVFITDNNGMQTKKYSVEHGDLNATGAEVFQGGTSVLWVLIRDNFEDDIVAMMKSIANAAQSIASDLGITGNGLHGSLFNVVSHYCWEQSSKYFACTLYEDDRTWSYITPWLANPSQQYNGVYPLTQALGDQYQAERLWVERRIAYIFSRYGVGLFSHDITTQRDLSFTLGQQFRFRITPAIDLYPVISQGSTDYRATRTEAGDQSSEMVVPGSDSTTVYVHGGDWISSLGDLHAIVLAVRGGDTGIDFSVTMQRIQELIIGGASGVTFNATTLTVESPTIKRIDARNTVTIINSVSLMKCPRLREVLFAGSGATGLELPVGSKVTTVSFPDNITSLYLNSLAFLANITWPSSYVNIRNLYVADTPNVNALTLLEQIMNTQNNKLAYVTLIGDFIATASQVDALGELAAGDYGRVVYNGSYSTKDETPDVQGSLTSNAQIEAETVYNIEENFPDLDVNIPDANVYIDFADEEVERICLANWDTDSSGTLTLDEAKRVTAFSTTAGTHFRGNTVIETFDEMKYFTGIISIASDAFNGCTSLSHVTFPTSLRTLGIRSFRSCPFTEVELPYGLRELGQPNTNEYGDPMFGGDYEEVYIPDSVITAQNALFSGRTNLKKVRWSPNLLPYRGGNTGYAGDFNNCLSLTELIDYPWENMTGLAVKHFNGCPIDLNVYLKPYQNNLESFSAQAFSGANARGVWTFEKAITNTTYRFDLNYGITSPVPNRMWGLHFPNMTSASSVWAGYEAVVYARYDNIETMGQYTLRGLGTFVILSESVPQLTSMSGNSDASGIFVRPELVDEFKQASNWSSRANYILPWYDPDTTQFCDVPSDAITLPSGYTRLEYIATDGSGHHWADLGYKLGRYAQMLIDINMYQFQSGSTGQILSSEIYHKPNTGYYFRDIAVFRKNQDNDATVLSSRSSLSGSYSRYGRYPFETSWLNRREVLKRNYRAINFLGQNCIVPTPEADDSDNMRLFITYSNSNVNNNVAAKVYRITFFEPIDGITDYDDPTQYEVVRDYIPCLNGAGTAGLYERITGTFIMNGNTSYDFLTPNDF